MAWPLIKLLPQKTNFKFVRFAAIAAFASFVAVGGTFVSMVTGGFRENPIAVYNAADGSPLDRVGTVLSHGFALGIDFRGGTLMTIQSPNAIDPADIRRALEGLDLGEMVVQQSSCTPVTNPPYCALVSYQSAEATSDVTQRLQAAIPNVQFLSVEGVSAKVSDELFGKGLSALGWAIALMLVYIWFRFEWQFGLGAVVALFHDVILTLGLFSVFRIEFTLVVVAALLTIIGYSMNDTVVVFDRLRENYRKFKKMPRPDVIDLSTNETLSRTMMTSVTVLIAAVALWVFGGEALRGFGIAMTFGVVIGTYSSIYVAAPVTLLWQNRRGESVPKGELSKSPG
ncbi:MAG: protein translocase subunit SecF [Hyphomonadaceae bacterium]|nr:protein translocase subunit SecF [Hyphomonadaceae bacterium]